MILKSDIREDLQSGPCEKCGEHIYKEQDHVLTFYRGRFIILHEECADFIDHATKGPRKAASQQEGRGE